MAPVLSDRSVRRLLFSTPLSTSWELVNNGVSPWIHASTEGSRLDPSISHVLVFEARFADGTTRRMAVSI